MLRVDYYLSLMSPYTYLAGAELERIADRLGVGIDYKPMDVMAVFEATGGVPVGKRHPARKAYRLQDLERSAAHAGLPLVLQPAHFPTDVAPASAAVIAAQSAGISPGHLVQAFLRAVWAEERNVGDPAEVQAILSAQGVTEEMLAPHREEAEATYRKNTEQAIEAGVFGAPFYIVGDALFWGQDRLPHLDAHLTALLEGGADQESS